MKNCILFLTLSLVLPNYLFAGQSWICTHNQNNYERIVEVQENEDGSCVTFYRKPTEEGDQHQQKLYFAKNEKDYCLDKAQTFVDDKLVGSLGWECQAQSQTETQIQSNSNSPNL